jgi:uncharacterized protein (UPF0332 family)
MRPYLEKAGQSFRSAELLLTAGDLDGAVNRASLFAHYGDGVHERAEAELAIRQAADFLAACDSLLDEKGKKQR